MTAVPMRGNADLGEFEFRTTFDLGDIKNYNRVVIRPPTGRFFPGFKTKLMPERCEPQAVNFPPTRWLILAFSPESDWCFLETMIMSYTCRGEALNVIVCLRVLVRTSSSK